MKLTANLESVVSLIQLGAASFEAIMGLVNSGRLGVHAADGSELSADQVQAHGERAQAAALAEGAAAGADIVRQHPPADGGQ